MSDDDAQQPEPEEQGTATDSPTTADSPGALLKSARERKGLSLDEMASQTLLSRSTLQALEDDDFDSLSQPVFVRGYYRKCAKILGLPEAEVMQAYEARAGVPGPQPASPGQVDVIPQDVTPRSWRFFSLFLLLLAVLALVAVAWWAWPQIDNAGGGSSADVTTSADWSDPDAGRESSSGAGAADADDATGLASGTGSENNGFGADATPPPSPGNRDAGEEVARMNPGDGDEAADDLEPADTSAPAGDSNPDDNKSPLLLKFNQRSWVEVRDVSGERLLGGIMPAGSERHVTGEPPFRIALGNAPGVEVRLDGEPVAIEDKIRSNNTARFVLTADTGE